MPGEVVGVGGPAEMAVGVLVEVGLSLLVWRSPLFSAFLLLGTAALLDPNPRTLERLLGIPSPDVLLLVLGRALSRLERVVRGFVADGGIAEIVAWDILWASVQAFVALVLAAARWIRRMPGEDRRGVDDYEKDRTGGFPTG